MQNVIKAILEHHGLTISHEAPNVQQAVLHGELLYTLAMASTINPDTWVDDINAAGDIVYNTVGKQPYNNQGKDTYMEINQLDHYKFFMLEGKAYASVDFMNGSQMLNTFIRQMRCNSFSRAIDEDVLLNRAVLLAFKHFDIKPRHINYQDPYLCYLLQKGILLKTLQFMSIYYAHDMSCIDRISESDGFTQFGVAVMFSESIDDVLIKSTPLGMPDNYCEVVNGEQWPMVADLDGELMLVTGKPVEAVYGVKCKTLDEAMWAKHPTRTVRKWGSDIATYLRLNLKYTGAEYPATELDDIYLLSIVERGLLIQALHIYADRSEDMTWRDLSSLAETEPYATYNRSVMRALREQK